MAGKGRPPRPLEVLRLQGSHHTSERKGEVAIVPGDPVKPANLGEYGSALWDRQVDRLRNQGILSPAWQESLAALCERWQRYQTLVTECRLRDIDDPLWKQCKEAFDDFMKVAREFGLTPASKTSVRTEPGLPKNRKGYIKRA